MINTKSTDYVIARNLQTSTNELVTEWAKVKTQFHKAKDTPRADLLSPKEREKKAIFPLVVNFNPHLPIISKIIKSYRHFIYDSPTLAQICPKGAIIPSYRRAKNIKELLARPKGSNYYSNNDHSATGCFKCSKNVRTILRRISLRFFTALVQIVITLSGNTLIANLRT